jgi:hypothetical protein
MNEFIAALYQKMSAEQDEFRAWLLSQAPETILHHATEYSIREDIVIAAESLNLTEKQAKALLASETPLADVYRAWNKTETHHMDDIADVIKIHADYLNEESCSEK